MECGARRTFVLFAYGGTIKLIQLIIKKTLQWNFMNFFRKKNTVTYSTHHLEKAAFLINLLDLYAVATYAPLREKFPELKLLQIRIF